MNIKALITSLVIGLGTSSVALAAPAVGFGPSHGPVVDSCANIRVGAKGSEYTGPVGDAARNHRWIELTQPTKLERGRELIPVGVDNGRFDALRLVANRGATTVKQVVIEFGDGQYQTVAVDRTLDPSCVPVTVRLDNSAHGRFIKRIVVDGSSSFGARYSILAA